MPDSVFNLLMDKTPESGLKALHIMQQNPDSMSWRDRKKRTPLHLAAYRDHANVVEWLLVNGADINAQSADGSTALHFASNPEIIKMILAQKPNVSLESKSGTAFQVIMKELEKFHNDKVASPDSSTRDENAVREIAVIHGRYIGNELDLQSAIRLGLLEQIDFILSERPSLAHRRLNSRSPEWTASQSPLREAAAWGQLEVCRYLINTHKVNINDFEGGTGYPVILRALRHPSIVELLVEKDVDLQTRISYLGNRTGSWIIGDDATALHFAVALEYPETVRILLNAGIDPFAEAEVFTDRRQSQTALDVAAIFGMHENANLILEHPQFKNEPLERRRPVVNRSLELVCSWHYFSTNKSSDRAKMVRDLIEHGAEWKTHPIERSLIRLATNRATDEDVQETVAELRRQGVPLDLYSAVAIGDRKAIEELSRDRSQPELEASIDGNPALHLAIQMDDIQALRILLDAGFDKEVKSQCRYTGFEQETPLICCASYGNEKMAKMLIAVGANVNARADEGVTSLHVAARHGRVNVMRLLLMNGADKWAEDDEGQTPLDWARSVGRLKSTEKIFAEY